MGQVFEHLDERDDIEGLLCEKGSIIVPASHVSARHGSCIPCQTRTGFDTSDTKAKFLADGKEMAIATPNIEPVTSAWAAAADTDRDILQDCITLGVLPLLPFREGQTPLAVIYR
jgi:hypothetical protein